MKTSIISFLTFLLFLVILGNQDGAFPENTGAPLELTCGRAPCHNIPSNIGSSIIQIEVEDTSTYVPNAEQAITVSISNTSSVKHGFEILALNSNNENIGNWVLAQPAETKIISGIGLPSRMYVTHTAAGNQLTSWTINWKAPPTDVGNVTFYASVIASNSDATNMGDSLYLTSKIISADNMVATGFISKNFNLGVFPNPVNEVLFLENKSERSLPLRIYNSIGQLIFQKILIRGINEMKVNNWEKGVYFIQYQIDKKLEVQKVVIR